MAPKHDWCDKFGWKVCVVSNVNDFATQDGKPAGQLAWWWNMIYYTGSFVTHMDQNGKEKKAI